ncbi:hypothetical protein CKO12_10950 [Chromatium okenii]|uniref:hypothetical protein n=1 Tax=Chromatium okenii TaxID=61644 RepID=UPI0019053D35|nr:hypothetical protein [Chromatium okenii]MBK1642386.1 hypothetical protein [Chromatium okenii]
MTMRFKALAVSAALPLLALNGCVGQPVVDATRAPAQTGGRFLLGGLELLKPTDDYGFTGELSASEQALREQGKAFDRTVWQATLLGAVAGTAIGAVVGGDAEDMVGGAIAGASLGALAGLYVANKQKQFAAQEDQLEAMTNDVRSANRNTQALIDQLQKVIAEDQRRLAAVQARFQRGQATAAELQQERGRIWSNRTVVEKATTGAKDQYRLFERAQQQVVKARPAARTQTLTSEISAYRQTLETLDRVAANMAKA